MKIKVESDKIIKAVKKLDGIEMVLEDPDDAKEAIDLILRKTELLEDDHRRLKGIDVTSFLEYKTSAVDYEVIFVLEFVFEDGVSLDTKVGTLKKFQEFFNRA